MKRLAFMAVLILAMPFNFAQCTYEINSPAFTNNISGWGEAGMQFTAISNCVISEVVFDNQGLADTVKLYNNLNQLLYTQYVPPGTPVFSFNPNWPLTAGVTYRLTDKSDVNGRWVNAPVYPVANTQISVEGMWSYPNDSLYSNWWFHFSKIETSGSGSSSSTDVVSACDNYVWIDGNTYTSSNNTATHTLLNSQGCDSVITLNLTIGYSNTGTDVVTACDSYVWLDGNTYTSNNSTATHTITNSHGCDSMVTLNLTINNSNSGSDTVIACDSYVWIDGNTYTASNTTATHTVTNSAGCDSIVTLNLTINSADVSVTNNSPTITANAIGAAYQWIDCNNGFALISGEDNQAYTALSNGSYAVIITENSCVDTSACINVVNVSLENTDQLEDVFVYPNPTTGTFFINLSDSYSQTDVVISNSMGQIVSKRSYTQSSLLELMIDQASGIYIVEIRSDENKTAKFKVVKK